MSLQRALSRWLNTMSDIEIISNQSKAIALEQAPCVHALMVKTVRGSPESTRVIEYGRAAMGAKAMEI